MTLRTSAVGRFLVMCLVVGVVLSATLLVIGAPSGAAPLSGRISSLRSQAASLSRQMILEQLQIGGYQQQYAADAGRAANDQVLLVRTGTRIASDRARLRRDSAALAKAAVRAYVRTGNSGAVAAALFNDQRSSLARKVYESVVTGDLTTGLDRLRTDQHALAVEQDAQRSLVARDQSAQAQASTMLADAEGVGQSLAQQSASVSGQLASALSEQQSEQAAAVAAALASVRRSSGSSATAGGAVPALPSFLRCVVQAESRGDYQVVSPTGQYMGAFQFAQGTWNYAAQLAGIPSLVGVPPYTASVAEQNALAIALYAADGQRPWYDPCDSA
ncbi:MAG: hypothetical protein ACRDWN_04160 [Acidimicrobiales bacterium]